MNPTQTASLAAAYDFALDAFNAAREALSERDSEAQSDHAVTVTLAALEAAAEALATVEVGSDVYRAGYTDDGVEFVAESYHVTVTEADGSRLVHRTTFSGAVAHDLEDGFGQSFEDVRPQARAQATRLADRVRAALAAGQALNPALWQQDRPVYGSEAYVAYGQDEDNAWEARCNQDETLGLR